MKTISIGIVGTGCIGKIYLANKTRYVSQVEVVALPNANSEAQPPLMDLKTWRYTKPFSISLCVITILIYVLLGS